MPRVLGVGAKRPTDNRGDLGGERTGWPRNWELIRKSQHTHQKSVMLYIRIHMCIHVYTYIQLYGPHNSFFTYINPSHPKFSAPLPAPQAQPAEG